MSLLFYSIDPRRDSAAELAQYLEYFAADIRGLRPDPQATELALPFEQALSLRSDSATGRLSGVTLSRKQRPYAVSGA